MTSGTAASAPVPPVEQHDANPFVRTARPRGIGRWIPGLAALRTYQPAWLAKDLMAGLVLTAILVPVGMGYAEAAGLPAIYGLHGSIVPLIAYAIFGPSRILVLGPDSSLAAIIAATIVPLAAGDPDRLVALAGLLAVLTGLVSSVPLSKRYARRLAVAVAAPPGRRSLLAHTQPAHT